MIATALIPKKRVNKQDPLWFLQRQGAAAQYGRGERGNGEEDDTDEDTRDTKSVIIRCDTECTNKMHNMSRRWKCVTEVH